jgi:hypothetical protein
MSRYWLIALLAIFVGAVAVAAYFVGKKGVVASSQEPVEQAENATQDAPRNQPGFVEAARQAGITFRMRFLPAEQGENFKVNLYDHGCGVAVADYDGDGFEDIYFANQLGLNALYRNKGDGTFVDMTADAGVGLGDRVCVGATFADYTNEGRQSLYVTSTRGGNVLFRNMGNGKFKDVTKEAGLTLVAHSQTAVFFDFDNDGYVDLFVTNTAQWTTNQREKDNYYAGPKELADLAVSPREFNVLYRNNRDGTFTDVTDKAGLKGLGWGGDVAVFDFNDDGYLDLLVTNMFGRSQLYRNNGNGTFTDVTRQTLGCTSWGAIGAKSFDFNNDGKLDLLIVDMHSDMWMPLKGGKDIAMASEGKKYPHVTGPMLSIAEDPKEQEDLRRSEKRLADQFQIRYDEVVFGNTLFKNLEKGKFREISDRTGIETFWPWGIATGDFDNDGCEDVFLPSGMGYPFFYWPNCLKRNNGDETFSERATAWGIEPPPGGMFLEKPIGGQLAARSSRCAATADFDGDGRLDIVTNNFNDAPYYLLNRLSRKNYIAFRLQGTRSNRDAVGALVHVHAGKEVMSRQVHAAGGYLSQSSKTLHFGLGDRQAVDRLEIRWPSGQRQTIAKPDINSLHHIIEPR